MSWFDVQRRQDGSLRVSIGDGIGEWESDVEVFKRAIGETESIELYLNSSGGDARTADAIFHLLRERNAVVTIKKAYSAAALISQGARVRRIETGGQIMFHTASSAVYGDAPALSACAAWLRGMDLETQSVLAERTKLAPSTIQEWFTESGRYFNADEAKEFCLVDEIIPATPAGITSPSAESSPTGFTDGEALLLDLLRAACPVTTRNRPRLARELSVFMAYQVIDG